ncbi:GAF domain-containing protein [Methylobacterium sp. BTF04]|uniref:GAF domain-containing protein n=1 Tax=Methylobacterium sp. BTF04 TaxID=2708300 RepID=UPI0032B2CFC4
MCDTPVALVSLVTGKRQWFIARIGFPACETNLNSSVCAHDLSEPAPLVILELTLDPRTRSNPLVIGDPHIRFHAGAPLRTFSGETLGNLCVWTPSPAPRDYPPNRPSACGHWPGKSWPKWSFTVRSLSNVGCSTSARR